MPGRPVDKVDHVLWLFNVSVIWNALNYSIISINTVDDYDAIICFYYCYQFEMCVLGVLVPGKAEIFI